MDRVRGSLMKAVQGGRFRLYAKLQGHCVCDLLEACFFTRFCSTLFSRGCLISLSLPWGLGISGGRAKISVRASLEFRDSGLGSHPLPVRL